MDPGQNQSQQRGNAANASNSIPHNQPANRHRHHGHQPQTNQTQANSAAGSYAGGPPVGAPNSYSQPNQQPVNTSHGHQAQGYTNNTLVVDPYTHSPVGPEGSPGSIRQTPPNPREAHMMGQQVPPVLQHSYSSRPGGSASGRERGGSHQPSQIRPGNAVSPHNVQEQHHYVHRTPVQPPATDIPGSSGFSRSFNNRCRIPDCSQLGYFNSHIQEQLDYCEAHIATALGGYAAACGGCGRLPVLANSDYCSRFCAGGGRAAASVPLGFAPACQECRRPITENMPIFGGHFCSPECCHAYHNTHSSRRG